MHSTKAYKLLKCNHKQWTTPSQKELLLKTLLPPPSPLRILLWFMSESVLPVFSSKSFIVSGLRFRSLIHFGLKMESNSWKATIWIKNGKHRLESNYSPIKIKKKFCMALDSLWSKTYLKNLCYFLISICICKALNFLSLNNSGFWSLNLFYSTI